MSACPINRAGDILRDPHRHAWEPGDCPWLWTGCQVCGLPREDHWSAPRRLLAWVLEVIG